uniref:chloride channel K isoform X8 n=1 Tax=Scatophagus argus TaxID=75038 RepID=UPI001ED7D6CA|nr:chloride channel K isoform X8 [Scatophagus argus]
MQLEVAQTFQDKMKSLDEAPGSETIRHGNKWERENQSETSHNKSLLRADPVKPCRRTHAIVKEWLLKLRCCLGAVCGVEWYGYAALGILTALLSFLMDLSVTKLLRAHQWLYMKLEGNSLLQFFCWTLYPACLCAVSSSFSHNICPFSTGVLFAMEVMCSHFALRNYCPCFFSAVCGAMTFHLFSVWSGDLETLQALFKTNFPTTLPFYPLEILLFAFLGLLCGTVSCCYLFCHRWILKLSKTNPIFVKMLTTEKCLYSGVVAFLLASLTFPNSAGQYMASKYTMKQLLTSLLDSTQWGSQSHNASAQPLLEWSSSGSPVYLSLAVFLLMKMLRTDLTVCLSTVGLEMWMLVVACTLPLPAGYFMPVFVYGAALGRLFGEGVGYVSYTGLTSGQQWASINPGGYALAGAAAFSGAVTHSLSPALLAIELTGQVSHVLPILLATLLANAVARSGHRPSFYDALSISKKLPHLPSLMKVWPQLPSTPIGQVLGVKPVQLQKAAGPAEVQHVVNTSTETQIPVVDSHESQILLGFVLRSDLLMYLWRSKTEIVDKNLDEVCCIYPTSLLLSPHNTVQEVSRILSLVGAQTLFVTDMGRLIGVITWPEMKRMIEDLAKEI